MPAINVAKNLGRVSNLENELGQASKNWKNAGSPTNGDLFDKRKMAKNALAAYRSKLGLVENSSNHMPINASKNEDPVSPNHTNGKLMTVDMLRSLTNLKNDIKITTDNWISEGSPESGEAFELKEAALAAYAKKRANWGLAKNNVNRPVPFSGVGHKAWNGENPNIGMMANVNTTRKNKNTGPFSGVGYKVGPGNNPARDPVTLNATKKNKKSGNGFLPFSGVGHKAWNGVNPNMGMMANVNKGNNANRGPFSGDGVTLGPGPNPNLKNVASLRVTNLARRNAETKRKAAIRKNWADRKALYQNVTGLPPASKQNLLKHEARSKFKRDYPNVGLKAV
jgi:hypothetical protein